MELVEDASGTCCLGEGRPRGAQDPFPGRAAADPSLVPPGWGLGSRNWWSCPLVAPACRLSAGEGPGDEEAGAQKG